MRKDGVRLKHADPMYTVAPYIMEDRSDACNSVEFFIPVVPLNEYIREKKKEGIEISHLAIVIAAYVRTIAEFPEMNRFIVNSKIYARKGIQVGMVVLKPAGGHTMSKMYFDPADDIMKVNQTLLDYVTENREQGDNNATDKIITTLLSIPGLVRFGVKFLKWWDKKFGLPEAIIKASPMHESMVITNLASIGMNHIYHHIYNFGTVGQVVAMGNLRNMPKRAIGATGFERCIPVGVVTDERIADGSYYAKAFRRMETYLKDPHLLEGEPKVCIREWELKNI